MKKKRIPALSITLLLTSCSFNGMFLHPTKLPQIPAGKNEVSITTSTKYDTTLTVFNAKTLQPTFLDNKNDTLELDYTVESFVFNSDSGNKLNGWLLKQKNTNPTISLLHLHGNSGFLLSNFKALSPLLNHGFQIFIVDYSGYGFSEGKANRKNILIDGNSALTYVKTRDEVKNTKLVIYGQSLGGHLAAVVAQQRQDEIDAVVIEGAFSSHKDIAAKKAGIAGRILVAEKYSALKSIQDYKKPVLIIHSTEDGTIPYDLGQKLFSKANEPKEFYEIKHCHICGPNYYADSISAKIKRMLE